MTRNPITITADSAPEEAAALMARHDIRHLPVLSDDACVGMLSIEAVRQARLLDSLGQDTGDKTVADLMQRGTMIEPDAGLDMAAKMMLLKRTSALAIVDGASKLLGILTQSDMLYHTLLSANPPPPAHALTLRNGQSVVIRPILPQDAIALRQLYDGLSANSRYYRFFQTRNPFNARNIRRYTLPDYKEHMAYVVEEPDGESLIGIAEYVPLIPPEPGSAEFSIAVADSWQGQGMGRKLMTELVDYACESGVKRLLGVIHRDNAPMLRLVESLGFQTTRSYEEGAFSVWIHLDEPV